MPQGFSGRERGWKQNSHAWVEEASAMKLPSAGMGGQNCKLEVTEKPPFLASTTSHKNWARHCAIYKQIQ
jgi:hypothetical protein